MTIALGILAPKTVVIAADTQESFGYAGGGKVSGYKIRTCTLPDEDRAISITGAGDSDYLEAASQQLEDCFKRVRQPSRLESSLRQALRRFYRDHVEPMHSLPIDYQPQVNLIIGVTWKDRPSALFATTRNSLHKGKLYTATGIGNQYALGLLSRMAPSKAEMSSRMAALLAAYVIFQVKEYVEGCGKGTHVTLLHRGTAHFFSENTIGYLEQVFRQYVDVEREAVHYVLGRPVRDDDATLGSLQRFFVEVRRRIENGADLPVTSASRRLDWSDDPEAVPFEALERVVPESNPTPTSAPKGKARTPDPQRSTRGRKVRPPSLE